MRAGVRANTDAASAALRDLLAAYVVDAAPDVEVPANYSVHVARDNRELHRLYWGQCLQVRSPDPRRIVQALRRHLGAHASRSPDLLAVNAVATVRDGRATLLPSGLAIPLARLTRRLGERGVSTADVPFAEIDTDRGELVLGDGLPLQRGLIADLVEGLPPARRDDPGVAAGRYPIERWLFHTFVTAQPQQLSPGAATQSAVYAVRGGLASAGRGALGRLANVFSTVRGATVAGTHEEILSTLTGA